MPSVLVKSVAQRQRIIDAVFARANKAKSTKGLEETEADFARHLIILLAGYFEKALAEIVVAYASGKAPPPIVSYLDNQLQWLTNVDRERLVRLIGTLDAKWQMQVEVFVVDKREASLNSVIALRNNIAHGGAGSVSLLQVSEYWKSLQEVVQFVNDLLAPAPVRAPRR